jgi:cellulose synthase/poly-beta-1,6-N-acetylglucosamine synthase-like glycosyltransferase
LKPPKIKFDFPKAILMSLMVVILPLFAYHGLTAISQIKLLYSTLYCLTCTAIIFEVVYAIFLKQPSLEELKKKQKHFYLKKRIHNDYKLPKKISVIIAAYLPNEKYLIIDTLKHFLFNLKYPSDYEIILAYNTPKRLRVESELEAMSQQFPQLKILKVEGSTSKASNQNTAINLASGEMIALFDADHRPSNEDCFARAWHWIANGYDVVQGRCAIRNYKDSLIASLVAVEFEIIYGLCHEARSIFTNTAIFGGSNAYWRADTLKVVKFNKNKLTEDIDATLRLITNGYKLVHDRTIVATEEAPTTLKSLWRQRKRWSQGWLECTLGYQEKVFKTKYLNWWQKLHWFYTLTYRELFVPISLQPLGLMILQPLIGREIISDDAQFFLDFTFAYTIITNWITLVGAMVVKSQRYDLKIFLIYFIVNIPYTICKVIISLVAWYDHIAGETSWVVTPRAEKKI